MYNHREQPPADDTEVLWQRNPTELVRRMAALADEIQSTSAIASAIAGLIREVLECEYNPLPSQPPQLGGPPNRGHASRGIATEPGS